MNEEVWKQIVGFPNYYVSDMGRIKNADGHILKPYVNHKGYLKVGLMKNGTDFKKRVHRLVAEAFIPNKDNLPEVNHINLDKRDNRVCNLEWASAEQNRQHYYIIRKYRKAISNRT